MPSRFINDHFLIVPNVNDRKCNVWKSKRIQWNMNTFCGMLPTQSASFIISNLEISCKQVSKFNQSMPL